MEYFKPARRYNSANYEREEYCYDYITARLDLKNINWWGKGLGEWYALNQIAERIAHFMRYNAQIEINGEPMTIVDFWDMVKRIEYAPGLDAMYYRLQFTPSGVQWPIKRVIRDDLLNAVYNRVNRTMNKDPNHEPARKFHTQNLILTEEEVREYQAMIAQRQAKAEARAARQRKKGGKGKG